MAKRHKPTSSYNRRLRNTDRSLKRGNASGEYGFTVPVLSEHPEAVRSRHRSMKRRVLGLCATCGKADDRTLAGKRFCLRHHLGILESRRKARKSARLAQPQTISASCVGCGEQFDAPRPARGCPRTRCFTCKPIQKRRVARGEQDEVPAYRAVECGFCHCQFVVQVKAKGRPRKYCFQHTGRTSPNKPRVYHYACVCGHEESDHFGGDVCVKGDCDCSSFHRPWEHDGKRRTDVLDIQAKRRVGSSYFEEYDTGEIYRPRWMGAA